MRKIIYSLAISVLSVGMLVTSCNSPSDRAERANEKARDAQRDLREKEADAELKQQRAATDEEWRNFKSETEVKIKENETRLVELRAKVKKPGGGVVDTVRVNRITNLEQKNAELRSKMNRYETEKSDWESFKREFNRDMDELGKSIKDFTEDNKK